MPKDKVTGKQALRLRPKGVAMSPHGSKAYMSKITHAACVACSLALHTEFATMPRPLQKNCSFPRLAQAEKKARVAGK